MKNVKDFIIFALVKTCTMLACITLKKKTKILIDIVYFAKIKQEIKLVFNMKFIEKNIAIDTCKV